MNQIILHYQTHHGADKIEELVDATIQIQTDITKLELSGKRIVSIDLIPLQHCKNLQNILLYENLLEQVDISALFACHKLKQLSINEQTVLTAHPRHKREATPEALKKHKDRIKWQKRSRNATKSS